MTAGTSEAMLISQLAERAGVPATTLRFYEDRGLLPAGRTSGGYRVYDRSALDRLAFIATAKRLGLELPQIRDLLAPWQHGTCRQVQDRLGALLDARVDAADRHAADLAAFRAELRAAREHLAGIDRDGPCDSSCSFLRRAEPPPVACSLDAAGYRDRAQRWAVVLAAATARRDHPGGVAVELGADVDVAALAALARAEAACCPFLTLTLRFAPAPTLTVEAPPEAAALVGDLFGAPDRAQA